MGNTIMRVNRVWVAFVMGFTEESGQIISHDCHPVKFILPEEFENTRGNAVWFYLNRLDHISTMSEDRMMNSADLPHKVVLEIEYYK